MQKVLFVLLTFLTLQLSAQVQVQIDVPERLGYCGMNLTLDAGAREEIRKILVPYTKSESYFKTIVQRCHLHIAWAEKAFREEGAPLDLVYIGMQESSFRGDAVSSSGAVGYWQMKEPAARASGLAVNTSVDERKHLYESSKGAARYFKLCNKDFDNWVYAIIGYNRGPAGALSYIDKKNYGATSLTITKSTHWYALKAIAHKLMFEQGMRMYPANQHLEGVMAKPGESYADIAQKEGIPLEKITPYNHWLKTKKVPEGKEYWVFYEQDGSPRKPDRIPDNLPDTVPVIPVKEQMIEVDRGSYVERNIFTDPDFGPQFICMREGEKLVELAVKYDVDYRKMMGWNGIKSSGDVKPGQVLYTQRPKKAQYHIVQPGETLTRIAEHHETTVEKIAKANRFSSSRVALLPGQKLYLKGKRPSTEKIIVLVDPDHPFAPPIEQIEEPKANPKPQIGGGNNPQPDKGAQYHTVQSGETLWRISQQYNRTVEEIKKLNGLKTNEIYPGQRLRVK